MSFDAFDKPTLDQLCAFFTRLTELRILIHVIACSARTWTTIIFRRSCPNSWQPTRIRGLRDALVDRCPKIKSLWLDVHDFLFHWRKPLKGTLDKLTVDDEGESADG
ncbi:hypothetical protein C8R44DRAFT_885110 [Mycena epipterygia]|nr:hypothetical protein C8R44DRAFT_885110 [Mycena epipterygia]